MSNQEVTINIDQLIAMAMQGLDGLFFKAHKDKAKKLYKEISDGKVVDFATLTFKDDRLEPLKLKLALDQTEFVGHLTFHLFKNALQLTLRHIAQKMEKKQDLNIFNADNSDEIILLTPGVIQHDDKVNIMVVGILPAFKAATVKLQFLDPEQFKKQEQGGDVPASEAGAASDSSGD